MAESPLDRQLSGIQLRFVEPADLVGNREHCGSTGEHFIAQKCISRPLPLLRRPLEGGFQNAPISSQLLGEHRERLRLATAQQPQILLQRSIHVLSGFQERVAMALGFTGLWLQQVVPDVGAGEIEVASNTFQDLRPQQKLVANAIVRCLDLLKGLDPVSAGERHENQQSTESGDQHQPAVHRWYEADPRRRHRPHFTVSKRNPETECRFERHSCSRSANHRRRSTVTSCAVRMLGRSRSSSIGLQSTSNAPRS